MATLVSRVEITAARRELVAQPEEALEDDALTQTLLINVYAKSNGWLFDDLKLRISKVQMPQAEVILSEEPEPQCDAWIAVRTSEVRFSPDLSRTVACIHDVYHGEGVYLPGGERRAVEQVGAIVLSHPQQREILIEYGIDLERPVILARPLGALTSFTCRDSMAKQFTIGCVGQYSARKRFNWILPIARTLQESGITCHFDLVGLNLESFVAELSDAGISCSSYPRHRFTVAEYPERYQAMDCHLITSKSEAGPLTLFEALASGIPVVSTPVGWAPIFETSAPEFVRTADSIEGLAEHLIAVHGERENLFSRRQEIRERISNYSLDDWFVCLLNLAAYLGSRDPAYLALLDNRQSPVAQPPSLEF